MSTLPEILPRFSLELSAEPDANPSWVSEGERVRSPPSPKASAASPRGLTGQYYIKLSRSLSTQPAKSELCLNKVLILLCCYIYKFE